MVGVLVIVRIAGGALPSIGLRAVSVRYPGASRRSVTDVDLEVPDGHVTGVAGASEAGKTTLCLALSGLVPRVVRASFTGSLWVDGEDVDRTRCRSSASGSAS